MLFAKLMLVTLALNPQLRLAASADTPRPDPRPAFVSVTAGSAHFCGIDSDAYINCWGDGRWGQLGTGTTTSSEMTPVRIATSRRFRQVVAGSTHSCALTLDGETYCWGSDLTGVMGDAATSEQCVVARCSTVPVPVAVGMRFDSLTAGFEHGCGLAGGKAYCWGRGDRGQLGRPVATRECAGVACSRRPLLVSDSLRFLSISARGNHTCGVTRSGAYCWGDNSHGQLGDGTTHGPLKPVRVASGLSFRRVLAAFTHTCGSLAGGKTYCWGDNTYGQVGDGSTTQRLTPVPVKGGLFFGQLSTGKLATCGVANGRAYCWGRNRYGALGDGTFTRRTTPNPVAGSLQFAGVSAGREAACGVTTGHLAFCWGYNHSGRLGDGTDVLVRLTPVPVTGGLQFASVSTSLDWFFTCGVTTENRAYCWGSNFVGQLGIGNDNPDYSVSPVPVVGP